MANYGTYGLSHSSSNQSGREPSPLGSGHWFGSMTPQPCNHGAYSGCGGYGGYGNFGGHSSYGRSGCHGGNGGMGGYGGYGGHGGCGNPRPYPSSQWGSGWGN